MRGKIGDRTYIGHRVGWEYGFQDVVREFKIDEIGLFSQPLRAIAREVSLAAALETIGVIGSVIVSLVLLALSLASELCCVGSLGVSTIPSVGSAGSV